MPIPALPKRQISFNHEKSFLRLSYGEEDLENDVKRFSEVKEC